MLPAGAEAHRAGALARRNEVLERAELPERLGIIDDQLLARALRLREVDLDRHQIEARCGGVDEMVCEVTNGHDWQRRDVDEPKSNDALSSAREASIAVDIVR